MHLMVVKINLDFRIVAKKLSEKLCSNWHPAARNHDSNTPSAWGVKREIIWIIWLFEVWKV